MRYPQRIFSCLLLLLLLFANSAKAQQTVSASDSLALVALYNATDGANWTTNTNWLTGPVNTWAGIEVVNGRVFQVSLYNKNLTGTIPPELGDLTKLHSLDISSNNLSGSIPDELGNMLEMQSLSVYANKLTGGVPPSLGNVPDLRDLYLGANPLTGTIPAELGNLSKLQILYLNNCELSGEIPKELGNLSNLRILYLQINELTGSIPPELGGLTNLTQLYINNNKLAGGIPKELGDLSMLEYLSLFENPLSGSIPTELTNLTNLKSLVLAANNLSGSIPVELGSMSALEQLDIRYNRFEGIVPFELGNISYLQIANNNFSELPDFSNSPIATLRAENNKFTFEDIEPNLAKLKYPEFYAPQQELAVGGSFSKNVGDEISFNVTVGGSANQYQWVKDGNEIEGATSNSYEIASISSEDAGAYYLRVTSTLVPDLTLFSQSFTLSVTVPVQQSQTITFNELSSRTIGDAPFTVSATATSGLTVSFVTTSDKISIEGNQVTMIKAGQATITASQPGNKDFLPAVTVDQTFCINPANPAITFHNGLDTPTLISSSATGNQWYLDGEKIDGATGIEYEISEPGSYTVQTTVDQCASGFSDEFVVVITAFEESRGSTQLAAFPNPASDKISLSLPEGGGKILVLNQNGVSLHQQTTTGSSIELKVACYNQGLYLVKVVTAKGNYFTKFIKD